jgi:hypothetical protein
VCRFHIAAGAGSAPCQKPVRNNLQKWFLSLTGRLNFGFITEGKPTVVLITPYSWGSQLVVHTTHHSPRSILHHVHEQDRREVREADAQVDVEAEAARVLAVGNATVKNGQRQNQLACWPSKMRRWRMQRDTCTKRKPWWKSKRAELRRRHPRWHVRTTARRSSTSCPGPHDATSTICDNMRFGV